jgi:hypothetical protein
MNRRLNLIAFLIVVAPLVLMSGCNRQIGDYVAVSSISRNGYARNEKLMREINGNEIKVWGFVDHSNIFADDADYILGDWLGGKGPGPGTWRFNLKSEPDDDPGASFMVCLPNDEGRDKLLKIFVTDAKAGKPTRVFVKGRIFTFDAPVNFSTLTGLRMEVESTENISVDHPDNQ